MKKVVLNMSMSLDGFIAGPNINVDQPMGEGGERLHQWIFGSNQVNARIVADTFEGQGSVILGNTTFELGEKHWNDDTPLQTPSFVITRKPRENIAKRSGEFVFVTDGIESALSKAKAAAGNKNVLIMGGANVAQQFIGARLIDELHIQMVPVLLCNGVRLFGNHGSSQIELEKTSLIETPEVTHFVFRVVR